MAQVTPDCGLASKIPLLRLLGKPAEYRDVLLVFYTCFAVVSTQNAVRGHTDAGGWFGGWEIAGSRRAGFIWVQVWKQQAVGSRGNESVGTGRAAINALATDGSRLKEWEACKSEALQGKVRSGPAADIYLLCSTVPYVHAPAIKRDASQPLHCQFPEIREHAAASP
ncbi:hypothetical protein CKAH01_09504 [Colletotrichum kahawae]|uniref:Uncharacterized protein n=1 Tax=Colletotrichum kahawae TaxID=34407 RepID=A0AAD9XZR1_COLKA|nr:hypothetical protein CKAH01_09504 [Colletotrichum kahawae]